MTQQEARKLSEETGVKIRHVYFTRDEYVYYDKHGRLRDEKGYYMLPEFWDLRKSELYQEGWSIIETKK